VAALPGQSAIYAAFDWIRSAATELNQADNLAPLTWPPDVPPPGTEIVSVPDKAAYDLIRIATAYCFLHEVQHIVFCQQEHGLTAWEEELACDRFAEKFLLSGVLDFADEIGELADEILEKRVSGIALAAFVLFEVTAPENWGGTRTHPPIADRLKALFSTVALPPTAYSWNVGAALLIAKWRASGRPLPQFVFADEKDLFEQLVSRIGKITKEEPDGNS